MITKHIDEYKLFKINEIPDGAMFVPKTDLAIDENTYVYTKICYFDIETFFSDDHCDTVNYVWAVNTDGEIECFRNDDLVYCVSEYDYKLCI